MTKKHPLNLRKLSVGTENVEGLQAWQAYLMEQTGGYIWHTTRSWPRRADELLNGGSIYWIIKGQMVARQKILSFEEEIDPEDPKKRFCRIMLDPTLVKTVVRPHRPFQGWRYLEAKDAPDDASNGKEGDFPGDLEAELKEMGIF